MRSNNYYEVSSVHCVTQNIKSSDAKTSKPFKYFMPKVASISSRQGIPDE